MSEHHQHQHVAMAVGSGETIDQAIFNAVAGLTDPQGHHGLMTFDAFEVLNVKGATRRSRDTSARSGYDPGDGDVRKVTRSARFGASSCCVPFLR